MRLPRNVIELPGVEMDMLNVICSAHPDHRNPQSLGEACLIINAAPGKSGSFATMFDKPASKVAYHESGATNFADDLIVDFVVVFFFINTKGSVTRISDRRFDSLVIGFID